MVPLARLFCLWISSLMRNIEIRYLDLVWSNVEVIVLIVLFVEIEQRLRY